MKRCYVYLFIILFVIHNLINPLFSSETKQIRYSYLGNFLGLINVPDIPGKLPVIIYSYDEFYDWAGKSVAYAAGYNLDKFAETFSRWGYITIIPIERYRKVNAVIGAYEYIKNHPKADLKNIHFMGVSEGAFMGLIAYQKLRSFKSLTLIAPVLIDDKGYLSVNEFQYVFKNENTPILFLEAKDVGWRINNQREILTQLMPHFASIEYYSYDVKKRYFWDYRFSFMKTIQDFLARHYN